jgi:acyl carrier protein
MPPSARPLTTAPVARSGEERLLQIVATMLHELRPNAPGRVVRLDDSIERDLGLDSLSRVELMARVERDFGVRLPERLASAARTPGDLLHALADAQPGSLAPSASLGQATPPAHAAGLPDNATTIIEAYQWHLDRHPGREHISLIDGDAVLESMSYERLWTDAREVAAGLVDAGIRRGDTLALMLPTGSDFFRAFIAALQIGAVPVPMYPPLRWSEIEEHVRGRAAILANSQASMLLTVPEAMWVGELVRAGTPHLHTVTSVDRLRRPHRPQDPTESRRDAIAMLQYTSGSTGDPKGVILTHDNLLANIRVMGRAAAATSTDRFMSWLPLYHDMGLIGAWLATMYHAVPLVLMSPAAFLARPSRWLWAIHHHRATLSAGPNFAYEIAASKIANEELTGLDLRSWRLAFNGAEPVRAATLDRFAARFAPYGFDRKALTPVYGLAESALALAFPPLHRGPLVDRIDPRVLARDRVAVPLYAGASGALDVVSCGRPLPDHELRVVDEAGREMPSRHEGRVEFRGPSATAGYYRNPAGTAKLFHGEWLDTGDVGYIADGELFLTSRAKDLIKRGGHTLHPYDLEAAVGDIPGIRKGCVAVFGATDRASGTERVIVVAETSRHEPADRSALRDRIMALSAIHLNAPADEVILVAPRTVLKTSSGKIRRAASRDLYERGLLEARRAAIWQQLARLTVRAIATRLHRAELASLRAGYGIYSWLVFGVLALGGFLAIALLPGGHARYRVVHRTARTLLRLLRVPISVQGLEHLQAGKPMMLVVNHASYVDAIVVVAVVAATAHFAAKREFAHAPLLGFVLSRLGTYFLERGDPTQGVEDMRQVAAALRNGETIVMFPEGTFSRAPGLAPFRLGAFVASAQTGVPVVPIALRGTRSVLRDQRALPARCPVEVSVLSPISPCGQGWSDAVRLRDQARAAILRACGEPDLAG